MVALTFYRDRYICVSMTRPARAGSKHKAINQQAMRISVTSIMFFPFS